MVVFTTTIMELSKKSWRVLGLFFREPLRKFKFKDVVKLSGLHKDNANNWLQGLMQNGLVKRVKPRSKHPYYVADTGSPEYRNSKRLYALEKLKESGLLNDLLIDDNTKTAIIFGSFNRSDWHKDSDIDLFILGRDFHLSLRKYEKFLEHEFQLFHYSRKQNVRNINKHLLKNILRGFYVKGDLSFLEVS